MFNFGNALPGLILSVKEEIWPIAGSFTISRGSKTEAAVLVVTVSNGNFIGRGECVPYARYGETVSGVKTTIEEAAPVLAAGNTPYQELMLRIKPGAARNAIDCAIWDFAARSTNTSVTRLAGLSDPLPRTTAYTISLGSPEQMAARTRDSLQYELLKIKLGGEGDDERMMAVREAAPNVRLIADANEAWSGRFLEPFLQTAKDCAFELVEQPLPETDDHLLKDVEHKVPICADESCHDLSQLEAIGRRYDAINIKLDKAGGFGEALAMARRARELDLLIMIGCMVGTSLAMAPALLLAEYAEWIDLDGPLLLARDREPGLVYSGSTVMPPVSALWG